MSAAVAQDPDISITNEFRIDNVAVVFDGDRISEVPSALIPGSSNYFGLLKYDYLTLSDSGSYSCTVMYGPEVENEFVRGGILTGTPLVVGIQGIVNVHNHYTCVYEIIQCTCILITITIYQSQCTCTCIQYSFFMYMSFISFLCIYISIEPTPNVKLTATEIRFPNHNDYNDQIITCTATLPLILLDEIEFDKVFKWTLDSVDVTSSASDPTDPEEIMSTSDLPVELSTAGDHVIGCEVSIQIPTDPEIVSTNTITVTVLSKFFLLSKYMYVWFCIHVYIFSW